MADGTENIRVHVRVRPLNETELARGDQNCLHIADDGRTVRFVGQRDEVRSLAFDSAISGSSQAMLFATTETERLLQDAIEGYAVTIFAYGQTGSGKTFTMTGHESHEQRDDEPPQPADEGPEGLIPRGVGALFAMIAQQAAEGQLPGGCAVRASYLELYNESLNDLLNPESTNLQLRSSAKSGAYVENLLQVECESVADAMMVFAEGTRNRKVGSHALNRDSSRSHCLMTLHLARRDAPHLHGRVCFVDLAGSERLPESHSTGEAAKETGHINKSLFALGNVISALADSRKRGGHIPYRDSKLTRLLQDSLGGEGRTLMLACCSPSSHHRDETLNTLAFASRTKNIQNRPVVPADGGGSSLLQQMHHTIRALQEENASLRHRLTTSDAAAAAPAAAASACAPTHPRHPLDAPRPVNDVAHDDAASAAAPGAPTAAGAGAVAARHMGMPTTATPVGGEGRPKVGLAALRAAESGGRAAASGADAQLVAALKQEVSQLRTTNDLLRRSHEQVVRENQTLQAKLERLELIFENGER